MVISADTTLTEDHDGSIVIAADDITLGCAGFTVSGPDLERGISIEGYSGVTVEDCVMTGFLHGLVVLNGSSNVLRGNSAFSNSGSGIVVDADDTEVVNNVVSDNADNGIETYFCTGNTFNGNVATGNGDAGFVMEECPGSQVVANVARANGSGFTVAASTDVAVRDNLAADNDGDGFRFWRADESLVADSTARGNAGEGFRIGRSHRNAVLRNEARGNGLSVSLVFASDESRFRGDASSRNHRANGLEGAGFEVSHSSHNRLIGNRPMANQDGFINWNMSGHDTYLRNTACRNEQWDAFDKGRAPGNVWRDNRFCHANV